MNKLEFLDDDASFRLQNPEQISYLYFPLANETGLKSAITPNLGGDSKLDQETFLLEPVSTENLHTSRSTRNFWCITDQGCWSAAGVSARQESERFTPDEDASVLTAGIMWHKVCRDSKKFGLRSEITSFVPCKENVELMSVRITNTGSKEKLVTGVAAIPIYGRSADNIRDHRNVTSMLHRIRTTQNGVLVKPTMSFDEKGHRTNSTIYYVLGSMGDGIKPKDFYPTVDSFLGEGGTFLRPRAVYESRSGVGPGTAVDGREAVGGIRFPAVALQPGQCVQFQILLGISRDEQEIQRIQRTYQTPQQVEQALKNTKAYWQSRVNVSYRTGNVSYDRLLRWISFQPFLRRIYGCSFLPHHDYGRGGRGWRDLWQDCLSLLLMDPGDVGRMIKANFGGVRIDGTNATIIGAGDGNFIADRNGIARVWMDHALWPLMTTKLYIDQTGDVGILLEKAPYFKDAQGMRGTAPDTQWDEQSGSQQRTADGQIYQGTILEHLLLQHLAAFYEVGSHNIFRLRGADWNDALDMAAEHGESVAFTCAYAGNLLDLADLVRRLDGTGNCRNVEILEEMQALLADSPGLYDDVKGKNALLESYALRCLHTVSGQTATISVQALADHLEGKARWLMDHIRRQEWISAGPEEGWFNSYYDNHGRQVEGMTDKGVRMMLTGQVFAVMSGTASNEQVKAITKSADHYLYRKEIGGYRLNTDFQELKFDMGRMFGFAYGEKENGAVFSHMTVMYANALYRRGFVREGYRALQTLADAALSFETSKIYPGIPEYFNADGRGVYHYLTGAASWYMLTVITQAFGVRGENGDLIFAPQLVREQFDDQGSASIGLTFAEKRCCVTYVNREKADWDGYRIQSAHWKDAASGREVPLPVRDRKAILSRAVLQGLPQNREIRIEIELA